jgi:hypothetical protein
MGVGMPSGILLQIFGQIVFEAFGAFPYHVGSSVNNKVWRDVDVRLILPDEEYENLFGSFNEHTEFLNLKWQSLCLAFSSLGKEMTGLPIDFQIQQMTFANEKYPIGRSCLDGRGWGQAFKSKEVK